MLTKEIYDEYMEYLDKWNELDYEIYDIEEQFYYGEGDVDDKDVEKIYKTHEEQHKLEEKMTAIQKQLHMSGTEIVMEGGNLYVL